MEPFEDGQNHTIRFSNSPRRSPQITQVHKSPVRSLHPQLQQSNTSHCQQDAGMRTLDFFDDSSGDEDNSPIDPADTAPDLERRGSATKKRHSNAIVPASASLAARCESRMVKQSPAQDGYQPLSPTVWADSQDQVHDRADTESTSFNGSVDELLPSNIHSSPPQFLRSSRISSGRTPRSSAHIPRSDDRHSAPIPRSDDRQSSTPPAARPPTSLAPYAIAHELTLQALMRDEASLDGSLQGLPLAPLQPSDRGSMLPAALSMKDDPRSPKIRDLSSPQSVTSGNKRVQVVPPPIDVREVSQRSLPSDLVRTPYPFSPDHVQGKDFSQKHHQQPPALPPDSIDTSGESILTLTLRRTHPNSQPRVTTLAIPAPATHSFTSVRNSGLRQKEQHFQALDFDDAEFFRRLHTAYKELAGPWRLFSARSFSRIIVSSSRSASESTTGWLHGPRSPPELAYKGLEDSFSEAKLLQHFRRPAAVKGRYAFVHWAHRLAAAPPSPQLRTPRPGQEEAEAGDSEVVRLKPQSEGLEFVTSWSAFRITGVLLLVLTLSVAAALLWTLLGRNSSALGPAGPGQGAGFRGAGDRVTSGALMGICVLLLGLSGMGGWLGVSWLVM